MCDAKSPPTRKSVIIEINIRQEQYIITIIMNLMLREISILLLLTMASVCRAMATWDKYLSDDFLSISANTEKHAILFGSRELLNKTKGVLIAEYDLYGELINEHFTPNHRLSEICIIIQDRLNGGALIVAQVNLSDESTKNETYLQKFLNNGTKEWEITYYRPYTYSQYYGKQISDGGYIIVIESKQWLHFKHVFTTMRLDKEGHILWHKAFETLFWIVDCAVCNNGPNEELLIVSSGNLMTSLLYINLEGEIKTGPVLENTLAVSILVTPDNKLLLGDKISKHALITKVDFNGTVEYKKVMHRQVSTITEYLATTHDGCYLAMITGIAKLNSMNLVKLYPNGTERWRVALSSSGRTIAIESSGDNTYYILIKAMLTAQGLLLKRTIPRSFEFCKRLEGEICGVCGLGFYWNYTSCVPCSVGCVECLDIDHCINCSSRYAKTEDNRCIPVEEPCNCDLPNLTPECREKCALPVCSSNSSLPFTYKTDNKKVCTCPDEMLSNETHCLPKTDVGCHPLCDICAGEYCLQCKNITGIFVSRTHSIAVKCQCDYGYQFNSTACIPVKRIHNVQSSESLVAIALGIIGGLVAVGSVAFIMYLKYRRDEWMHGENLPDIQTGKEQHTVEVSKEMEVHAITRDDERTGEIMFKRE
eukprot:TRINITY_DN165_c0_g1_i11.p1 TRINITY_DN165_c0_g1~~TRINITY_DN165_c0_g1_i11.p1  ORF type:complete len:649 (+),score=21.70 TRINITY_DN165_c0_g1_i11:878-2824(+)